MDDIPQIGTKGVRLDLLVRQGATTGPFLLRLKRRVNGNESSVPINLTSVVLRAHVRKTADSADVSAQAIFEVQDAQEGLLKWWLDPADTRSMITSLIDEDHDESLYVWDMEAQFDDGTITPLLYGYARVFREVTKETLP